MPSTSQYGEWINEWTTVTSNTYAMPLPQSISTYSSDGWSVTPCVDNQYLAYVRYIVNNATYGTMVDLTSPNSIRYAQESLARYAAQERAHSAVETYCALMDKMGKKLPLIVCSGADKKEKEETKMLIENKMNPPLETKNEK